MSAEVVEKKPVVGEEIKKEAEGDEAKKVESPEKKKDEKEEKEGKDEKKEVAPPPPPPPRVHKADFEKDVVYLYQFCRTPVLPSLSPYSLKVESFLRLYDIKYENVDHKLRYKSAKGQLPFVELNGEEIADSAVIVQKLSQHFGVDPDGNLRTDEKNVSHALISMIENHLCWVYVYWRSKNPDAMIKGCKLSLQHALGSRIPNGVLNIVFKLTYSRKGVKKVKAHGLGVHSPEEILELGKQDLKVLEDTLGNKDFFFGDKPSNLDIVTFSNLSQIAYVDKCVEYDLRDWMLENCPNLNGFLARMKERCFPDWDTICTSLKMNTHLPEPEPEEKKDEEKEPAKEKEGEKGDEIKAEGEKKEEVKAAEEAK
ncbi:failed axon connections [Folsomia candida]|uniref:Failed axon connections n=1 Tax=Folsomia candida TaxID=158441 RepID=A0A226EJF1_FOLCA|nr:failed axon connections [Folsomia candida]OXA57825.1 Failed axon connections [Folsomia candida]